MKQLFILLMLNTLFSIQCRPDPVDPPKPTESFSDIIVLGPWTVDFQELKNGVFVSTTQDCMKDDTWTFHANSDYEISENAQICDPTFPYSGIAGGWSLKNNDTQLFLELDFSDYPLDISAFGPNEVILHEVVSSGATVTERVVLTR